MDSEMMRYIRVEIARQLNVVLTGQVQNSTQDVADVINLFAGMPAITARPVVSPYGYASVAPDDTVAVIGRQGDHNGNRIVLGHRAADKPKDLAKGEGAIYSSGGYSLRVRNGKIELGKAGAWHPAVIGDTLNSVLISIIQAIVAHTHSFPYSAGPTPSTGTTLAPLNATDFTLIKTQNLDTNKILAEDGGAF